MKLKLVLSLFMTFSILASEFSSFQTGEKFYQLQDHAISKSLDTSELDPDDVRNFSSIYGQILGSYQSSYDLIGTRLSNKVKNGLFGGTNMVGWQHAGDFHAFKVMFNRSIAPGLFKEDKYLVNDELVIEIDAAKFLNQLAKDDVIKISEQNLVAFAGLVFRRTMRYNHFADSQADALQTDFDKLFMMFKYFKPEQFHRLSEYDYLTKEDSFTLSAGGMVGAPLASYGAIGAGALYSYENKSKVTVQKLGVQDNRRDNEVLRLSVEDSKVTKAGANVTLLIDFFKILKMTLLQYEFEYERSQTYKTYMSLFEQDLQNSTKMGELRKVLRYKDFDSRIFSENITSKEIRQKEIKSSKYLAFIFGGVKKSQTESVEIVKDGVMHKFFKHNYEKFRYKENFLSKLLANILGKLIGYEQLAARTEVDYRTVNISYESNQNLLAAKKDFNIFASNVFTMNLGDKIRINQKTRLNKNKIESKMRDAITSRSKSYHKYKKVFDGADISAPSEFTSAITMDNKNVAHFMRLNTQQVFSKFKNECKSKSKNIFKRFSSLFSGCRSRLYNSYNTFLKEWTTKNYTAGVYKSCAKKYRFRYIFRPSKRRRMISKCMEIKSKKNLVLRDKELPLWRFKDVVTNINNYTQSISSLDFFFGKYFNKGSFSSNLNGSSMYKSYYSEGSINENIVDQFRSRSNLRAPASVDLK